MKHTLVIATFFVIAFQTAFARYSVTAYIGVAEPVRFLWQAQGEPLALASADLDEDGVPDLVSGCTGPSGNTLTLERGGAGSIYPNHSSSASLSVQETRTFAATEAPNFIGTGDFDADGHFDVVIAANGSDALYLLSGDGRGDFGAALRIELSGRVTTLLSGEINRADGLTDVVVGVAGEDGPKLLIFEGPEGALGAEREGANQAQVLCEEVVVVESGAGTGAWTVDSLKV
jgi:hypothetical protein